VVTVDGFHGPFGAAAIPFVCGVMMSGCDCVLGCDFEG
jgi:hypothetical protein